MFNVTKKNLKLISSQTTTHKLKHRKYHFKLATFLTSIHLSVFNFADAIPVGFSHNIREVVGLSERLLLRICGWKMCQIPL